MQRAPPGYVLETVMVGSRGVKQALLDWGDVLLRRYGKTRGAAWERDSTLRTLGYGTQNGAYYYYNTGAAQSYEAAILSVATDARARAIPYRWWLADSWWYEKGTQPRGVSRPGVTRWLPIREGVFPRGLGYISNQTGWKMMGHNRYWSAETPYAISNGGHFEFLVNRASGMALPLGRPFWDHLFGEAHRRGWGLVGYEQDWMDVQTERLPALRENATLGRRWLVEMAEAADAAGVSIQYCMTWCRHILASVEMAAVTQARGSGDYRAGNDLWRRLGLTSLLLHSLGLAPSKDTFWTVREHPGNRWGPSTVEPHARLQAAVATLSRGPVSPSDAVGRSDRKLIMRSVTDSGTLLQPSEPLVALDLTVLEAARGRPLGELWFAVTMLSEQRYGTLFTARIRRRVDLRPADLGYPATVKPNDFYAMDSSCDAPRGQACTVVAGLPVVEPRSSGFGLWSIAPRDPSGGWTLLGEVNKWAALSTTRFVSIASGWMGSAPSLVVSARGERGESITVAFVAPEANVRQPIVPHVLTCTVPRASRSKTSSYRMMCRGAGDRHRDRDAPGLAASDTHIVGCACLF